MFRSSGDRGGRNLAAPRRAETRGRIEEPRGRGILLRPQQRHELGILRGKASLGLRGIDRGAQAIVVQPVRAHGSLPLSESRRYGHRCVVDLSSRRDPVYRGSRVTGPGIRHAYRRVIGTGHRQNTLGDLSGLGFGEEI